MITKTALCIWLPVGLLLLNFHLSVIPQDLPQSRQKSGGGSTEPRALYEYWIGQESNLALMQSCSIFVGVIQSAGSDTLGLTSFEPLAGPAITDTSIGLTIKRSRNSPFS